MAVNLRYNGRKKGSTVSSIELEEKNVLHILTTRQFCQICDFDSKLFTYRFMDFDNKSFICQILEFLTVNCLFVKISFLLFS